MPVQNDQSEQEGDLGRNWLGRGPRVGRWRHSGLIKAGPEEWTGGGRAGSRVP